MPASFFHTETMEFVTPLPAALCIERLRKDVDSPWTFLGNAPLIGRVNERTFRVRKRIPYRNSFQITLSATLTEHAGHTRVHCHLGVHPVARLFMALWLAGMFLIGVVLWISTLTSLTISPSNFPPMLWLGLMWPPLLMLFGAGLVLLGSWLARGERDFLVTHLRERIEAREG
jgi:hypothetical protein